MTNLFEKILNACPCASKPPPETRIIHVDNKVPNGVEVIVPEKYPSNRIISSKYTLWNFLPKNLFEQFHRIANIYFVCVALVEFLIDSPVSPWTSIVPLVFVLVVTAIKQGYEDILRHRADREVNDRIAHVVRDGKELQIKSQDIHVGDVVRVVANEPIPCDMVMLSSADPEGECYITTANLDGETNLKTFNCIPRTRRLQSENELATFRATIECEQPITDLYNFNGVMKCYYTESNNHLLYHSNNSVDTTGRPVSLNLSIDSSLDFHKSSEVLVPPVDSASTSAIRKTSDSLGPEHVLLRGSRLKNTAFIYGCAIYTGPDTKVSLNSKYKSHKYSRVEKKMNVFLIIFLIVLAVYSAIWVGIKYSFYQRDVNKHENMWYVQEEPSMSFVVALEEFLAFMVLCNYVIPISMYVTIELQKFFGSMFFGWDVEMYDAQANEPAKANTSDLNEELGQIEYLFTDKTGTLTENSMQFRQCSIQGQKYVEVGGMLCTPSDLPGVDPTPIPELNEKIMDFFLTLAVCHTVRVDRQDGNTERSINGMDYDYQASSPDEKAFVEAARRYGIVFHGIRDDNLEVTCRGRMCRFKVHHTLEFDPTRKRMSVIVQDNTERYWLLSKGAETAILDRATNSESATIIEQHINDFAVLGLRTLAIAKREFTEEEYFRYDKLITDAKHDIKHRKRRLAEAYDEVERDFELLGATAVEDRLQDGVPETLTALQEAGIKVWVLTGDKEETAVNISYSAGHFTNDMEVLSLTKQTSPADCEQVLEQYLKEACSAVSSRSQGSSDRKLALVVDGMSLAHTLAHHSGLLQDVCRHVATVLCCRMSPLQKAEVVKLMKFSPDDPTTAAIGDGANDVSMIQEAHVGIGIMGKEGRQAVRSSDYAFGRFKFLRRALLVHGHYFYHRLATLVQYFFYKNVAMITAQLYFTFFSAFSAQTVFDSYFLTTYNVTATTLPVLLFGLFELNFPMSVLEKNPQIYPHFRKNASLSALQFIKWNLLGLWHSLVFFFGTYFAFSAGNTPLPNGKEFGVYEFGAIIMTMCVFTVNIKLMLESYYWNGVIFFGFILTFAGYFILGFFYAAFTWDFFFVTEFTFYKSLENLLASGYVWFILILLPVIALFPDIMMRMYRDNFSPLYDHTQYMKKQDKIPINTNISTADVPYVNNHESVAMEPQSAAVIETKQVVHSNNTISPAISASSRVTKM